MLYLIEWSTHGYAHGLAFIASGDHTSVIIRQHDNSLPLQIRAEDSFARNEKIIAVDQSKHTLPYFLDDIGNYSPHLEIHSFGYLYDRISVICRYKPEPAALSIKVFESEFTVNKTHAHIALIRIKRTVYHKDVSFVDTGINHRVSHHTAIECRCRMSDKFFIQVNRLSHVIGRRRRKASMYICLGHSRQDFIFIFHIQVHENTKLAKTCIFAKMHLLEDISGFLIGHGIGCCIETTCGLKVISASGQHILPIRVTSTSLSEAEEASETCRAAIAALTGIDGRYPIIITEDRWNRQRKMMETRLLSHLEIFSPIYARNCEVRKIDKKTAGDFLNANHSYGDASCRYRYGLFLKRYTGHTAAGATDSHISPGTLVAVATFSNARKWVKADKVIRSYEWTRYASLPEVRLSGGMGKMLNEFIRDVDPDDIMTYADLEWSEGKVYEQLGFVLEGIKGPVSFCIDEGWNRTPSASSCGTRYFINFGSNKYRLKLTDYK